MIKSIRIQNFKSLRDVTVNLAPLTVLIGRSGTGKSNFVQAIRFLRDYLTHRSPDFLAQWGGWPAVACATRTRHDENKPRHGVRIIDLSDGTQKDRDDNISFELRFEVPNCSGVFEYALWFRPIGGANHAFDGERLLLDGQVLLEQESGHLTKPEQTMNPPASGTSALGAVYGIPELKIAHLALTGGIGCYDFAGNVLMGGRFDLSQGTSLDDSANNYLAAFSAVGNEISELGSIKEIVAALRQLNGDLAYVQLDFDRSAILVSHRLDEGRVLPLLLAQESEGLRRFLAHFLALYQRPPKQVLAFEEPEKGIYPGALAVLADFFRSAANRGRSQVILTTHSPQLLDHFGPENIRVVEIENGETKIGPLAPEQRESLEERLLNAGELLTVVEPHIELAASGA